MSQTLLKAILVAVAGVPAIFGATLTYTSSFPETLTDFTSALPIRQFDPAFGNLSSLTITLSGDVQGTGTITSQNSRVKTYNVTLSNYLTLQDPELGIFVEISPIFTTSLRVAANSTASVSGEGSATQTNSYSDQATLNEFTGPGNLAATIDGSGSSGFGGASNSTFNAITAASGFVTIVYSYLPSQNTQIPEPLTACLIGLGLIALGFVNNRKRAI